MKRELSDYENVSKMGTVIRVNGVSGTKSERVSSNVSSLYLNINMAVTRSKQSLLIYFTGEIPRSAWATSKMESLISRSTGKKELIHFVLISVGR